MFKLLIHSQIQGEMFLLKETMTEAEEFISSAKESKHYGDESECSFEVIDLLQDPEYLLEQCHQARRSEYPPMEDYLDAIVKGDEQQKADYIAKCLAIKAKYPKS
ncbi:MAG: hypothetical protein EBZ95_04890 [Chitinophagia bacterium]|nr:hypothetical protein [Chitinophagia bacterium]